MSSSAQKRIVSLDAFRGAVIVGMVLVNNPGDEQHVYRQLAHVAWDGMTFADLIAPCFLWMIGITTAISLSRRLEANRSEAMLHVLRRSAVLFAFGVAIMALPALLPGSTVALPYSVHLMGILQRIAICYALTCALYLSTGVQARWTLVCALLIGYWLLLEGSPGFAHGVEAFAEGDNWAYAVDRSIMGHWADISSHSIPTIITATCSMLLGTLTADLVRSHAGAERGKPRLIAVGIALCVSGAILSVWVPIIRRIWTPSYVLVTAGIAMLLLAAFHWLIDTRGAWKNPRFLVAYGANPIALFLASEAVRILATAKGYTGADGQWRSLWNAAYRSLLPILSPQAASAAIACLYTGLFGLGALALYRRGWILKV